MQSETKVSVPIYLSLILNAMYHTLKDKIHGLATMFKWPES